MMTAATEGHTGALRALLEGGENIDVNDHYNVRIAVNKPILFVFRVETDFRLFRIASPLCNVTFKFV